MPVIAAERTKIIYSWMQRFIVNRNRQIKIKKYIANVYIIYNLIRFENRFSSVGFFLLKVFITWQKNRFKKKKTFIFSMHCNILQPRFEVKN